LQKFTGIAGFSGNEAGRVMICRSLRQDFFAGSATALAPVLFGTAGPSGVSIFVTGRAAKVNAPLWAGA